MTAIFNVLSVSFIPILFTAIIVYGLMKRAPIYDYFIEGVKDGLKTAAEILPFIIAIFIGIEALVTSGAMEFLEGIVGPVLQLLGVPEELTSLILLRPVSGSGSLVLVERILVEFGADSFPGRVASVMAGSCETVFYVLAVYFGATAVKHVRHALWAGIIGYVAGVLGSVLICSYL